MRGPILGIIAIFMLQLGVIGYGTISRFFDATADVAAIVIPSQPQPMLSDLDFADPASVTEVDAVVSRRRGNETEYASVRAERRPTAKRPAIRTFETDFRPVTITVPTPSPYTFAAFEPEIRRTETPLTQASEREPLNFVSSARGVDVRNKRGFLAKTFTVIKKPYDWLKVVGSKLK